MVDIGREHSAVVGATMNTAGQIGAIISPLVVAKSVTWLNDWNIPLYLLGAPLVAGYPMLPLFENQGLGIALFSYGEHLFWGFNADWDLMPDLHQLVRDVHASFDDLHAAALGATERPRQRRLASS